MKKSEEVRYFDKVWAQMNLHLANFLETGNQQELHGYRVQIKKLKALINLLENADSQTTLNKLFKPVAKLFKKAGKVREAYVNLLLTEQFKINNQIFELEQQKIIDEGIESFRLDGKKFLKDIKEAHKLLTKSLPKIKNSTIAAYYKNQLEQIAKNLEFISFSEEMHQNRKQIKLLVYNHKLVKNALTKQLYLNEEYLDKLQETIGKWHDNVIAAQLFSSTELNEANVVKLINRKNAPVKKSIKSMATDFIKKATIVKSLPEVPVIA